MDRRLSRRLDDHHPFGNATGPPLPFGKMPDELPRADAEWLHGERKAGQPARAASPQGLLTATGFCLHNASIMLLRLVSLGASELAYFWDWHPADRHPLGLGEGNHRLADKEADDGNSTRFDTGTVTRTRPKTKRPSLYRVLLLNDDYTPMEFVVLVLQEVFNKSREEAMRIMLHVHNQGVGECGVYPFEVAETKVTRVMDTARKNQHPLQCVMEKE
jgi:ATP-dependent Clp protease adaptor protein ClpS